MICSNKCYVTALYFIILKSLKHTVTVTKFICIQLTKFIAYTYVLQRIAAIQRSWFCEDVIINKYNKLPQS